jgi:hypothetical protein
VTLRSQADAARAVHPPALARAAQPVVHGHASGGFVAARSFVPAPGGHLPPWSGYLRLPAIRLPAIRLPAIRLPAIRLPAIRSAMAPATAGLRMRPRAAALMPIFDVEI